MNPDIPTPESDTVFGPHVTGVRSEKCRDLERRLTIARNTLKEVRGFVETVCHKTLGEEYKSCTLEDIDKALKTTEPKP